MANIEEQTNMTYWEFKRQEVEDEMTEKFVEITNYCAELNEEYRIGKIERVDILLKIKGLIDEYENIEWELDI
jgi:hypothetical protein